nr:MAG: hypothetical protein [Bacteriophage sp.]
MESPDDILKKLESLIDMIKEDHELLVKLCDMVEKLDGLRGFGSNVLANIVGDIITRK